MGIAREANDFLIDSAPGLLEACTEALEILRHIAAGRRPPISLEDCCGMLEGAIAAAEGPYRDRG